MKTGRDRENTGKQREVIGDIGLEISRQKTQYMLFGGNSKEIVIRLLRKRLEIVKEF